MNLAANLTRSAATQPDRVAVRLGDEVMTYGELDESSARVAGLLAARGVGPGQPVAIMLPNVPEFAVVYYGVLRAGGVVVPMNPLLKAREVSYYLGDSGAPVIFAWHTADDEVAAGTAQAGTEAVILAPGALGEILAGVSPAWDVVDRDPDDTAVLLYTSGTTGRPKGAELTQSNLTTNTDVFRSDLLDMGPDDVVFGGLPLFHSFGQTCTLNAAISVGATLSLLPRFDPRQALGLVGQHHVTVFAGVPTMYSALLAVPDRDEYDVSSLRLCVSGGAAMPVEVLRRFEEAFGATVLEGYGLSETSPVASFNPPGHRKAGSIGTPIRGVEMRVVDRDRVEVPQGDVGEIAIRGHNIMKGYWGKPEATAEVVSADGWFYSGDLGRVDEEGYYFIVDRKKDLIIRGGYNVYPREIEEVLFEHADVAEAAVIGVPHPELGEEVAAVVALKPGASTTESELRTYVKGQVAAYKYPRYVWFVQALPKGPTGKILKREIAVPEAVVAETARRSGS